MSGQIELGDGLKKSRLQIFWARFQKQKLLLLLVLIPIVHLFIFQYIPIYGITIAFKNYRFADGIMGSPWNDFAHFRRLFSDMFFYRTLRNTVVISLLKMGFMFPAPILLALLLNEVRHRKFKRVVQSITYLPYFLSWVLIAVLIRNLLSPSVGVVGYFYELFGKEPEILLAKSSFFRSLIVITSIWNGAGYSAIIYLATMSSIDLQLYESAELDGANRFHKAVYITIPSIMPIITILWILNLGGILSAGFEQILNLYNPNVYEVGDILDTYIYRVGIEQAQYAYTTAVGLFKNLVGVVLIVGSNMIIKRFSEYGIW